MQMICIRAIMAQKTEMKVYEWYITFQSNEVIFL